MALNPFKHRTDTILVPLDNNGTDVLHYISIQHLAASGALPAVLLPVLVPERRAVDAVVAVANDMDVSLGTGNLERAQNGC
jgi:hypothetical protein